MKHWRQRPGAWYWECEKETMLYLNLNSGLSLSLISKEYLIPYSTLKRVWAEKSSQIWGWGKNWSGIGWSQEYAIIKEYIKYYWRTATSTFDSVDIRNQIKHDLGVTIECKNIRAILKNKLNFSFKKWSSRPINIESQRLNLIRT